MESEGRLTEEAEGLGGTFLTVERAGKAGIILTEEARRTEGGALVGGAY